MRAALWHRSRPRQGIHHRRRATTPTPRSTHRHRISRWIPRRIPRRIPWRISHGSPDQSAWDAARPAPTRAFYPNAAIGPTSPVRWPLGHPWDTATPCIYATPASVRRATTLVHRWCTARIETRTVDALRGIGRTTSLRWRSLPCPIASSTRRHTNARGLQGGHRGRAPRAGRAPPTPTAGCNCPRRTGRPSQVGRARGSSCPGRRLPGRARARLKLACTMAAAAHDQSASIVTPCTANALQKN